MDRKIPTAPPMPPIPPARPEPRSVKGDTPKPVKIPESRDRRGETWTHGEEDRLVALFNTYYRAEPELLAMWLGRTPGAIVSRLVKMGLVINEGGRLYRKQLWVDKY